jgi:hypothetical protein
MALAEIGATTSGFPAAVVGLMATCNGAVIPPIRLSAELRRPPLGSRSGSLDMHGRVGQVMLASCRHRGDELIVPFLAHGFDATFLDVPLRGPSRPMPNPAFPFTLDSLG